jgi:hypothetical protein
MSLKVVSSGLTTLERSIGRSLCLLVGHCDRQMERPGWPFTALTCAFPTQREVCELNLCMFKVEHGT